LIAELELVSKILVLVKDLPIRGETLSFHDNFIESDSMCVETRELIKVCTSLPPRYAFARTHHFGIVISGFLFRHTFGHQTESHVRYFDTISICYTRKTKREQKKKINVLVKECFRAVLLKPVEGMRDRWAG
jgi:hypothetical protein